MLSGGFALHGFLNTLVWTAIVTVIGLVLTYLVGRLVGKHSVVDIAWGLLFCAIAVTAFLSSAADGAAGRRWLLLAMTLIWGLRLATHIALRSRGRGEDPRYVRLLRGRGTLGTIGTVYLLQGALAYVVSMPIQVGSFEQTSLPPVAWVGAACWLVGVIFETVGDWQLRRFRSDPQHPQILDTGLWRYTRHPNYFGDACIWLGIFLVAAGRWPGILTVASLAVMIYLLVFGSGVRLLERSLAERPGYQQYRQRTSAFLPLPVRRSAGR